jgi:hypothetical protein
MARYPLVSRGDKFVPRADLSNEVRTLLNSYTPISEKSKKSARPVFFNVYNATEKVIKAGSAVEFIDSFAEDNVPGVKPISKAMCRFGIVSVELEPKEIGTCIISGYATVKLKRTPAHKGISYAYPLLDEPDCFMPNQHQQGCRVIAFGTDTATIEVGSEEYFPWQILDLSTGNGTENFVPKVGVVKKTDNKLGEQKIDIWDKFDISKYGKTYFFGVDEEELLYGGTLPITSNSRYFEIQHLIGRVDIENSFLEIISVSAYHVFSEYMPWEEYFPTLKYDMSLNANNADVFTGYTFKIKSVYGYLNGKKITAENLELPTPPKEYEITHYNLIFCANKKNVAPGEKAEAEFKFVSYTETITEENYVMIAGFAYATDEMTIYNYGCGIPQLFTYTRLLINASETENGNANA